jgi:hypothetical protein
MITPNSSNPRLNDLQQFIKKAREAWDEAQDQFRDKFPGVAPQAPPWPYVVGDEIAATVTQELSPSDKIRKQLIYRLKRIRYPYGTTARVKKSFYIHLKGPGLLTFLLSEPFLDKVRSAWFFRRYYELEKELFRQRKSQYGYPREFHRAIMRELSKHWERIVKIAGKHGVPMDQFAEYLPAIQKQVVVQASVCYPELQWPFTRASRITPHSFGVEKRLEIFDAILLELEKRKIKNDELAYQLTALACSGTSSIAKRLLDPTPDVVRLSVTNRK